MERLETSFIHIPAAVRQRPRAPRRVDGRITLMSLCAAMALAAGSGAGTAGGWQEKFDEEDRDLVSTGANPYFSLEPGDTLELEGKEKGKTLRLTVRVLNETKPVGAVQTRVVEERETLDGQPVEVSRNYFAISKKTGSVYYFGEDVDEYKGGKVSGHGGSWLAGKNGARYGMMVSGKPTVTQRYYQELAPRVAMDRAEVISITETLETPAGKFQNVLKTEETTPLERDEKEFKYYAAGVGLLKDGSALLVRHTKSPAEGGGGAGGRD